MKNLFLTFINSEWYITHETMTDPLDNQNWWLKILADYSTEIPNPIDFKFINDMKTLREQLQMMMIRYVNNQTTPDDMDLLNHYLSMYPSTYVLSHSDDCIQVNQQYTLSKNQVFVKDLLLSLVYLLTDVDKNRLKACNNPDCGWVFLDESKNASRKWCDNKCASLMKVRRYRQRMKN